MRKDHYYCVFFGFSQNFFAPLITESGFGIIYSADPYEKQEEQIINLTSCVHLKPTFTKEMVALSYH